MVPAGACLCKDMRWPPFRAAPGESQSERFSGGNCGHMERTGRTGHGRLCTTRQSDSNELFHVSIQDQPTQRKGDTLG